MPRQGWSYRFVLLVLLAPLALTACLDGGGGGGESVARAGDDGNNIGGNGSGSGALAISGSPSSQAMMGADYSFTPSVSDDGGTLSFAVENLPDWAEFDAETGAISGTPSQGDVREYTGIRITVSDGSESASLGPFSISVVATASGSATLSWTPPTQYTDGSSLNDLAGYKVYWGQDEDDMSNSATLDQPGVTSYVVEQLTPGTWFFSMKAFNEAGVESTFSNVASKSVDL